MREEEGGLLPSSECWSPKPEGSGNGRNAHSTPWDLEFKEVLLGFLESASSLCDMMNTTMLAVRRG